MRRHPEAVEDREHKFEILFDRHSDRIRRFAIRRVGWDHADDVVSATFLIAWTRLGEIPAAHEIEWLYGTARNVILTQHRAEGRRYRLAERLAREPVGTSADLAAEVAERDALMAALARQTPADQEVLRLAAWEALPPDDAARVLGCTRTAYRVRLHRARKRLLQALSSADASHADPTQVASSLTSDEESPLMKGRTA